VTRPSRSHWLKKITGVGLTLGLACTADDGLVSKLTLADGNYTWQFIPMAGQVFTDSGSGTCH
jgi:hypothetical protein